MTLAVNEDSLINYSLVRDDAMLQNRRDLCPGQIFKYDNHLMSQWDPASEVSKLHAQS